MLPGRNVSLSDEVRSRCAESVDYLIEDASVATNLFDAIIRKMRRKNGQLWPGEEEQQRDCRQLGASGS